MRLIIVSNRAPVNIIEENGKYRYEESPGGLASGLRAYVERIKKKKKDAMEITWIGWPGKAIPDKDKEKVKREISKKFGTCCVFLSEEVMEKFYEGFCNKTLWPLFHYFPVYAVYEKEFWEQYIAVNKIFTDALLEIAKPDDLIWIHDYHLMLIPQMVREKLPHAAIGFFLHIPFPSYEIFRLLPSEWRKQILDGLYGVDLLGFHTHGYRSYFLRSTLRILGYNNHMGEVVHRNHLAKADTFPMGIDFNKYHDAALSKAVLIEKAKLKKNYASRKIILSIDRQDYSKGILNRLRGYERFLENNPQWKQKVTLLMAVVPSRIGVESYQSIKSKIDELVGSINGKFGNMEWMPIVYQYRSLSFAQLIALYNASDAALVTPLRDGMNLIAKEYIACRTDNKGVLILSEMAGAIDELAESLIINPNNIEEISRSLLQALEMNEADQKERIGVMQKRLIHYDVFRWADDFINSLLAIKKKQHRLKVRMLSASLKKNIISQFKKASSRSLFLDYDGTLTPYKNRPSEAVQDKTLLAILENLLNKKNTDIVIVSGRNREPLQKWFGHLPVHLVAEHGIFIKEKQKPWKLLKPIRSTWKKKIIPILNHYAVRLPGSFVEEKEFSVAFHYRKSDHYLASLRVREAMDYLANFTADVDVQVFKGSKVLEVRNSGVNKGTASMHWLASFNNESRFVLAMGDDTTDEDLFRVMPQNAFSIRVGNKPSFAKFNLNNSDEVRTLLGELAGR